MQNHSGDFARQHEVKEMVTQIKKNSSKLDLLINNASFFFDNDTVDNDSEALEAVFQVHNIAPICLLPAYNNSCRIPTMGL